VGSDAIKRTLLRGGIVIAAAFIVFTAYILVVNALRLRQVRNCADLQTLTFTVEAFHEKTGRYPHSIVEAVAASGMAPQNKKYFSSSRDAWGNPYLYAQRADAFILVSYGRGGQPDGIDYWHQTVQEGGELCRNLSADIFANRSGVVRCCGK